jgi:hypothetical protein
MLRILFEILLPLLLPTLLYLVGLRVVAWAQRGEPASRAALPWVWLAAAGAVLLALMLFVVTVGFGTAQRGVYMPPRWDGGRILPGHIEPRASP